MAYKEVLKFLQDHNRPYSVNEIHSGVKGDFGKSAIQKALDKLVEEEEVKEKVYGKQKVYCIVQNTGATSRELNEQLLEIDRTINGIKSQMKDVVDEINSKSQMLSKTKDKMSLEEAIDLNLKLDEELGSLEKELKNYDGVEMVCPKEKAAIEEVYQKYLTEFKKRKRMCMDILNAILENYPKTKKHLFEDIGIETDEEVGFSPDN